MRVSYKGFDTKLWLKLNPMVQSRDKRNNISEVLIPWEETDIW